MRAIAGFVEFLRLIKQQDLPGKTKRVRFAFQH